MTIPDANRSPKRRWLSFSISVVFALGAIACVWFAVVGVRAGKQARAVSKIETLGGLMWFDYQADAQGTHIPKAKPTAPQWLRDALGEEYFRTIVVVDFAYINRNGLSDDGLDVFDVLDDVTRVDLGKNPAVSDIGLKHLAGLKKLDTLSLYRTSVTGPGIRHLPGGLADLSLRDTPLGDEGLMYLQALPKVKSLQLGSTEITDLGLVELSTIATLEALHLQHTDITDAGLEHLKPLKNLKQLEVHDTKVTGPGITRLQQALPNCQISPTSERLDAVALEVELWPAGHEPSREEILAKVKELGGDARVDVTDPAGPIDFLVLRDSDISDESLLRLLEKMPDLWLLYLQKVRIGDRLVQGLSRLTKLEELALDDSRLTDLGLVYVGQMHTLRRLSLFGTRITDAGLDHLKGLKNLDVLGTGDTRVTEKGRKQLRQVLTECHIF